MVIAGMGALASLGLALPTGLAFGYGYGYGVRQGYHAFRPSKSSVTKDLHLSANPVKGAHGAGLLSAEEMTSKQAINQKEIPVNTPSSPQSNGQSIVSPSIKNESLEVDKKYADTRFFRKEAGAVVDQIDKQQARRMMRKAGLPDDDRTTRRHFIKKLYPFNKSFYTGGRHNR